MSAQSAPFRSADGRALYVIMANGQRRRVERADDGELFFMRRLGKAAKKADKRAKSADRRGVRDVFRAWKIGGFHK